MSEFNLDREVSIQNKVDAEGKKWVVHVQRGNGLCYARPDPDRSDAVIPKEFQGLWTKPSLLIPKIEEYLNKSWNKAEKANLDAERKREVAREQQAAKKVKAKANDSGSASK